MSSRNFDESATPLDDVEADGITRYLDAVEERMEQAKGKGDTYTMEAVIPHHASAPSPWVRTIWTGVMVVFALCQAAVFLSWLAGVR